ncbi:MAG: hypothetical protein COB93_08255, partial [Sneathiella sp.]
MKHYEELTGGEGRRVFYRAERFNAKTLMSSISPVVDVQDRSFDLFDISMSGISFVSPEGTSWLDDMNKDIPLSLKLGPTEIFHGQGKVCRIEPHEDKHKVAIELTKGYLDIQNLLEQHDDLALRQNIATGLDDQSAMVSAEYKQLMSDAVYLIRSVKAVLDKVENEMGHSDPRRDERIKDIVLACEAKALVRWNDISKQCLAVVDTIRDDAAAVAATKRYTELVLTPEFLSAENWQRCYFKPLGYPGDFAMMNHFYGMGFTGKTAFEKFCYHFGNTVAGVVATRMTMVKQVIVKLTSEAAERGQTAFSITSLGCGPAQEVSNFLSSGHLPLKVDFTLIDQEQAALDYAYTSTYPLVTRLDGQATVRCLHASFVKFLSAGKLFRNIENQDLIYAVGLADYFSTSRSRRFATDLYENLNPGGTLVIGNMRTSDHSIEWLMEYVVDWTLVHRDESEMLTVADKID